MYIPPLACGFIIGALFGAIAVVMVALMANHKGDDDY